MSKVPPLTCPRCGGFRVSPGFTKEVEVGSWKNKWRIASVRDGRLYCYDCNHVILKNGKTKPLPEEWRALVFPEGAR